MTSLTTLNRVNVTVTGARGPRGLASGALGAGSVGAEEITDTGSEQDAIVAKLGISGSGGSAKVGHIADGSGAVATTVAAWIKDQLPTARARGAVKTGLSSARSAILAADAIGPWRLTQGRYLIDADTTITKTVTVDPGAVFVIADSFSLTFTVDPIAPPNVVIFDTSGTGAGLVEGLSVCHLDWWAGGARNVATDATVRVKKAAKAVEAKNGVLKMGPGSYRITGTTAVDMKGSSLVGAGRFKSVLLFTTSTTNGVLCSVSEGGAVEGVGFGMASADTVATAGTVIKFSSAAHNGTVKGVRIQGGYNGIQFLGINGGKSEDVDIFDSLNTGLWVSGSANIEAAQTRVSAFTDFVDLSTTAGFIAGESLTWTGGNGNYGYTTSGTRAKILINDNAPAVSATITGVTSGAVATMTARYAPHAAGGLRVEGNSPATSIVNSSFAGGVYAGVITATVYAHGSWPEYSTVANAYFDNSDLGLLISGAAGLSFSETWFASRNGDGVTLQNTLNVTFAKCKFDSCWRHGALVKATAIKTSFDGGYAAGCNRSTTLSGDGIHFEAGTTKFRVVNMDLGGSTVGAANTQRSGVNVAVGASDYYVITGNLVGGNVISGVSDGGTGTNKTVSGNWG